MKSNLTIVYRGEPKGVKPLAKDLIWVTPDENYAKEYGDVKKYSIQNDLYLATVFMPNQEEVFTEQWEDEVNGFLEGEQTGDSYEELAYNPTPEFISYLKERGYDGFVNWDSEIERMAIFDKKNVSKFGGGGSIKTNGTFKPLALQKN